jgi:hypothetical protein
MTVPPLVNLRAAALYTGALADLLDLARIIVGSLRREVALAAVELHGGEARAGSAGDGRARRLPSRSHPKRTHGAA